MKTANLKKIESMTKENQKIPNAFYNSLIHHLYVDIDFKKSASEAALERMDKSLELIKGFVAYLLTIDVDARGYENFITKEEAIQIVSEQIEKQSR